MTLSQDHQTRTQRSSGVVQSIDDVNRAVTIVREPRPVRFDVPAACTILLRGEPVKLHMLQPQDQVRVTYVHENRGLKAQTIEILCR